MTALLKRIILSITLLLGLQACGIADTPKDGAVVVAEVSKSYPQQAGDVDLQHYVWSVRHQNLQVGAGKIENGMLVLRAKVPDLASPDQLTIAITTLSGSQVGEIPWSDASLDAILRMLKKP